MEFRSNWRIDTEFEPGMDPGKTDDVYRRWNDAVERTLDRERDG